MLALISTIPTEYVKSSALKRAYTTTPAKCERKRRVMRSQVDQNQHEVETVMQHSAIPALHTNNSVARDSWPVLRCNHGESWPASAIAKFPLWHSSVEDHMTTASVSQVSCFVFCRSSRTPKNFLAFWARQF